MKGRALETIKYSVNSLIIMEIKSKEYFKELFERVYSTLQKSGFDVEQNIFKLPDFNKLNDLLAKF